jgi:UDP-3-O-[3-hydroxymyristoyl] glucosamine N-acyltransferase
MARPGLTVGQLADAIEKLSNGRLRAAIAGDADTRVEAVAPLDAASPEHLSFLANQRYRGAAAGSRAGAVVLAPSEHAALGGDTNRTWIVCDEPYAWFAYASQVLQPQAQFVAGCDVAARIDAAAQVDAQARVDAYAVVEAGARVGAGAWIGAGAFVGRDAQIGAATRLHPGARVLAGCAIGSRCIVHAGAVIGADGFGFAPLDKRWVKIPQAGRVVVGDDVEIGANTTIDRGTMGDTVIEDGVKMDNQIQIGHNCRVGAHSVIAGCVGIAGSATIGRNCQLGGAAMILGHLSIADGTVISSGTLVSRTISEPGFYTGFFPFMKNRDWERNAALLRHLNELRDRVRALEAQLQPKQTP